MKKTTVRASAPQRSTARREGSNEVGVTARKSRRDGVCKGHARYHWRERGSARPRGANTGSSRDDAPLTVVLLPTPQPQGFFTATPRTLMRKRSLSHLTNTRYLLCARHYSRRFLNNFTYFSLTTLCGRYYYHPHLPDEETKAQKYEVICPRLESS